MANSAGRTFAVKLGGTTIASVRQKSVNWSGTLIDTSSDDDDGVDTYLADKYANTSLSISVEGLADADEFSALIYSTDDSDKHLSGLTLVRPNGDIIGGTFAFTNFQETGQYKDAMTYTAELVRNGIHTWTPAV